MLKVRTRYVTGTQNTERSDTAHDKIILCFVARYLVFTIKLRLRIASLRSFFLLEWFWLGIREYKGGSENKRDFDLKPKLNADSGADPKNTREFRNEFQIKREIKDDLLKPNVEARSKVDPNNKGGIRSRKFGESSER